MTVRTETGAQALVAPATRRRMRSPALRFAFREMRGGLRGFYVFLACLALGVAAIAGIGSVAASMEEALVREGRAILGGDVSFGLVQRRADEGERRFLAEQGDLSEVASLNAMSRRVDETDQALIELKAVDNVYPLAGTLVLETGPVDGATVLGAEDGVFGALADRDLLLRLGLDVGDNLAVGETVFAIRGAIDSEPDRLSDSADLGPRLMISLAGLDATELIRPGSLVQWLYRIDLSQPGAGEDPLLVKEAAEQRFPDAGWRIRTSEDASPGLSESIERFADFLTLVGLAALLVGGVGIANAVGAYLDRKRDVIATFKCLGAPGGTVLGIYLAQIVVLAAIGILIGVALGAVMPFITAAVFGAVVPIPLAPGIYPGSLGLAAVYGLTTAVAFALWPLARARRVPAAALFRDRVAPERVRPHPADLAAVAVAGAILVGLAIGLAGDRWLAAQFVGAAVVVFLVLRIVARVIAMLARRAPRVRSTVLRLALANLHRPGALTPTVVLSLGLGLTLLVAISLVDGNLRRELSSSIPDQAPSFFFLDVQQDEMEPLAALLDAEVPGATIERTPMMRGRLVEMKGIPADQFEASPDVSWVLASYGGITFADRLPSGSRLVEGEWWAPDHDGKPLVSMEADIAAGLGLEIGDEITVNVIGRPVTAEIANLRKVDWQSLAINFVMVFSPSAFRGAPHTYLATLTWPDTPTLEGEVALLRTVTSQFPGIISIRVKEALDRVNGLIAQIGWGVRAAASITLVIAVLVLGGALAAGQRQRVYDAVILKTLGATRRKLVLAFAVEYLILGVATAMFALAAGGVAAWFVISRTMQSMFSFLPGVALTAVVLAIIVTVGFGLAGSWRMLGQKAAPVLRNL